MKKKRKNASALIDRIPVLSWYVGKKNNGYTLERVGKGLSLADAVFK